MSRKLIESHKVVDEYDRLTETGTYQDLFRFVQPNKVFNKYSQNS